MLKLRSLQLVILILLNGFPIFAEEDRSFEIVTSFTILENLVSELGGSRVSVTNWYQEIAMLIFIRQNHLIRSPFQMQI